VVRLFHAYLTEEGVRPNNAAAQSGGGRAMVARHHKLPWIPNEEDWQPKRVPTTATSRGKRSQGAAVAERVMQNLTPNDTKLEKSESVSI
jgi:hypothetical protein